MLVVKVELHSAITGRVKLLGQTIIDNVGGTKELGDYRVRVGHKKDCMNLREIVKKPLRVGEVKNYPRLSYNVWRLVIRGLLAAFPEEKK